MLSLAFDRKNRVLRVSVSGVFSSEDMAEVDRAVIEFVAREGQIRGIFDCTEVEAFAVPDSRFAQRAQRPPIMHDQRVIVASRIAGDEAPRAYGRYQREAGQKDAAVVGTLDEAYALLGLENPRFEPVER
jgi:hypothetical protein